MEKDVHKSKVNNKNISRCKILNLYKKNEEIDRIFTSETSGKNLVSSYSAMSGKVDKFSMSSNRKTLINSSSDICFDKLIDDRRHNGNLMNNIVHIESSF